VTGRVAEEPEEVVLDDISYPGGAKGEHVALGAVGVVDGDVEVELLSAARVGELRGLMLGGELEREAFRSWHPSFRNPRGANARRCGNICA
jgi:hypothetical protein